LAHQKFPFVAPLKTHIHENESMEAMGSKAFPGQHTPYAGVASHRRIGQIREHAGGL
jgi:hypothetical protein